MKKPKKYLASAFQATMKHLLLAPPPFPGSTNPSLPRYVVAVKFPGKTKALHQKLFPALAVLAENALVEGAWLSTPIAMPSDAS